MATVLEAVSVQRMTAEHTADIAAIEQRSFTLPWHANAFANELNNRCAHYFVAMRAGSVVGYGGMWLIVDEAHVTTLAVDPMHRGRGIGERLLHAILMAAIAEGAQRSTLEVRESNVPAIKLYEKYGYKVVAERKHYYPDNKEHAAVMWTGDLRSPEYQAMLAEHGAALNL